LSEKGKRANDEGSGLKISSLDCRNPYCLQTTTTPTPNVSTNGATGLTMAIPTAEALTAYAKADFPEDFAKLPDPETYCIKTNAYGKSPMLLVAILPRKSSS
jgi:hypothetical protein